MSEFWLRETVVSGCGREFRYPDYETQFRVGLIGSINALKSVFGRGPKWSDIWEGL